MKQSLLADVRIVLVEPSHPGNIGGVARAMKTMGLSDLALVNPGRFPDPQAEWRAAGAQDVLESARVYPSLDDALADRQWIVGTSTRARRIPWPVESAESVVGDLLRRLPRARSAILFGRETSGLSNDELQRCNCHLVIPANPEYPSLNLAMAVQVVCYELCRQSQEAGDVVTAGWDRDPASAAQTEALLEHFERVLVASGFLDASNPGQTMTRFRRLMTRFEFDEMEVQMLRGVLRKLAPAAAGD
ncbi:MAG: RNA methyltransferase [Pseudomonadales bacterium]